MRWRREGHYARLAILRQLELSRPVEVLTDRHFVMANIGALQRE